MQATPRTLPFIPLIKHPILRTRLLDNGRRLKEGLRRIEFPVGDTPFPVAAWKLKTAVVVFSTNTPGQIDRLLAELKSLV